MNTSYLASPEFLLKSLSFITFLELPVHWFGAYCIFRQTPDSMRSVKWSMLNLHFWSMLLDWAMSLLVRPFVIVPAMAGVPMGILSEFEMPAELQYYFCVVVFSTVNVSVISIVESRYYLLFGQKTFWRVARFPFMALNYCAGLTYLIYPFFHTTNQSVAAEMIRKKLPEIPYFVYQRNLFIMDLDSCAIFAILILFEIIVINETFVFGYLIVVNLEKSAKRTIISKRTYELQKKFLRALLIQIATPLLIIVAPLFWFGPSILFNIYNQTLNNFCVISISLHGFASAIVMLYIHEPYRHFCCVLFLRIIRRTPLTGCKKASELPMTNIMGNRKSISQVMDLRVRSGSLAFR